MRVLLTGVTGQLGLHLAPRLRAQGHDVLALDRGQFDLSKPETLANAITRALPNVVINPAAYTEVDKAETETELAQTVNATAVDAIARACAALSLPLIHFSTDYVFDGVNDRPWRETDAPSPLSVYGASKLAGEQAIARSGAHAIILRTSWVYSRTGKNFLLTMQKLAAERDALRVVADQHGTPNWAGTLADAVVALLSNDVATLKRKAGLYHLSSRGATTWHGFASAIVARGPRQIPVHALATADYPTPAKRPAYSVLDQRLFETTFGIEMPTWERGLDACLSSAVPTV